MAGVMNWPEALHDRRFWATHYANPDLFGLMWREVDAYTCTLCGCEGHPQWLGDEEVAEELGEELAGSRLDIPCPDGSTLVLSITTVGTFFSLQPPDSDQLVLIGSQDGHDIAPTWHWEELLQLEAWLRREWRAPFPASALLPLLLPQASLSAPCTPAEALALVRPRLTAAWRELGAVSEGEIAHVVDTTILRDLPIVQWRGASAGGWVADTPAFQRHQSPAFQHLLEVAARGSVGV
jgi:hypothetical protein